MRYKVGRRRKRNYTKHRQKGGLYIPRNRSRYGMKQSGGLGGFGNIDISQSMGDMRKRMRKKQRGGSRAGGMGMFGYKHKRGTGWKPKKSKFGRKIKNYIKEQLGLQIMESQRAKAKAQGKTYNPFKTY